MRTRLSPSAPRPRKNTIAARPVRTRAPTSAVTRVGGLRVRLTESVSACAACRLDVEEKEKRRGLPRLFRWFRLESGLRAGQVVLEVRARGAGAENAPRMGAIGDREAVARRRRPSEPSASERRPSRSGRALPASCRRTCRCPSSTPRRHGSAARRFAFMALLAARSRNPRYEGTAIASRMPMMMITTRSSIRVKPCSEFPSRRERIRLNIAATPSAVRSRWGVERMRTKDRRGAGGRLPQIG